MMKKVMPFLLIVFGFLTLDMFQGVIAITCMVIGIVIILEHKWPEKWGESETIKE